MLTRALIIVGFLAAALVALALAVVSGGRPRAGQDAPGDRLVEQPLWNAVSLTVVGADDASERLALVRRDGGGWEFERDGWPANDAAVRATLRLLAEPRVEGRGAPLRDATRIVLRFEDGRESTLFLERPDLAVGGRSILANERGAYGSAALELAQALGDIRQDAWRSPMAMPRVEAESSRITIGLGDDAQIALARVSGRWWLREPLRTRADDRRVGALLATLIDLRAQRFATQDDQSSASADFAPINSLRVETDRRTLVGDDDRVRTDTETTTLRVVGSLDDAGEGVVCVVDGVALILRGEALGRIPHDPAHFVARGALGASPPDIGMLAMRDARGREGAFRRALLSWTALGPEAERLLNPAEESDAIDLALQFLANAEPARLSILDHDAGPDDESTARLYGLADDERGVLGFRWESGDAGRTLVVREGRVERRYAESQAPRLLRAWLDRD